MRLIHFLLCRAFSAQIICLAIGPGALPLAITSHAFGVKSAKARAAGDSKIARQFTVNSILKVVPGSTEANLLDYYHSIQSKCRAPAIALQLSSARAHLRFPDNLLGERHQPKAGCKRL